MKFGIDLPEKLGVSRKWNTLKLLELSVALLKSKAL